MFFQIKFRLGTYEHSECVCLVGVESVHVDSFDRSGVPGIAAMAADDNYR